MSSDILVRAWRCAPWSTNPLVRPSDRLFGVIVLLAVACAVFIVPVAGAVGTSYYGGAVAHLSVDAANSHRVEAVLVEDGARILDRSGGDVTTPATWTFDGLAHRGDVATVADAKRGDRVPIWVSGAGDVVPAPKTGVEAAVEAAAIAVGICWVGAVLVFVGLRLTGSLLDRRRAHEIDAEWSEFTRRHDRWS